MALETYKITSGEIAQVHVEAQDTVLKGTPLQNKQVFDAYPDLITGKFNNLCDYIGTQTPSGDAGLTYTATEIATICNALDCTESSITM